MLHFLFEYGICIVSTLLYLEVSTSFMDPEAARTAKESLELVFQMSNILNTGLDRHTLSVLIALCDHGLNPEALAAVVKEFRKDPPLTSSTPTTPSVP
ncbi:hypothetical protein L6452_29095 [Arctium lappa]|uniref:Uncharacterized protein n=1 Tax=Arctium lappa TaxID=4217 RepID=A0ACB8ZFR9_ARCLA|nr:hypothetical protein L6452_29095 [Arctium lappa]